MAVPGAENQMHWRGFLTCITRPVSVVRLPPDTGQALLLLGALSVARLQRLESKPIFSSSVLDGGSSKSGGSCRTGVHEMAKGDVEEDDHLGGKIDELEMFEETLWEGAPAD